MTLHIGYKSPFRTNLLPTNLSGNGLFLFYMVFKKQSGLQRSVFSQAFHIFRPFFTVKVEGESSVITQFLQSDSVSA